MTVVAVSDSPVPTEVTPAAKAALLLTAAGYLRELGLPAPTTHDIVDACDVSRSHAYSLRSRLESTWTVALARPTGRPATPEPVAPPPITGDVLAYLYDHPGAVRNLGERRTYSDGFRRFVLELCERHPQLSLEAVADQAALPFGTLKAWRTAGATAAQGLDATDDERVALPDLRGVHLQSLLSEWPQWEGTFGAFCDHIQTHCAIPWKRTMIQRVLEATGLRIPRRRSGRSPDESALTGAFETWFPHAQWEGDGSQVPVLIDGELVVFNLELIVDAATSALLGAMVTATEDGAAVIETFREAIAASGVSPLSLLLDNKPSNHTDAVDEALGDTMLIRSTPYRPQSKPHVEGAYGLLKPALDGLELDTSGSKRDIAASYLSGLVTAVARVLNHRPRRDRNGKSRFQLLGDTPTPEETASAQKALQELQTRQNKARETRAARQNPVARERLAAAYEQLQLDDPKGHLLTATARYPLDAILDGIAIFRAKQERGTLPDGADARYLLGIVRNTATERESWELALALWEERVAARDSFTRAFEQRRLAVEHTHPDLDDRLRRFVELAANASGRMERMYWLTQTAALINTDASQNPTRYRSAARAIANTHSLKPRQRQAAIRFLASAATPLR